jgi:two-component system chemotaxis sensor kinase CheA
VDARRFVDLYASEARDHLRLLNHNILQLDTATADAAMAEAFRAAHTLKGIAAAMGHTAVAELAHTLEDHLDALRTGRRSIADDLIDELLAGADALERAVEVSLATATFTPHYADVQLLPETQLPAARASLIVLTLKRRELVDRIEPEAFDEDFSGTFRIYPVPGADLAAIESVIRAGGDVQSVYWEAPAPVTPTAAAAAAQSLAPAVRVDPRKLDALADGIGELTVLHARLGETDGGAAGGAARRQIAALLGELREEILHLRMFPVSLVFDQLPRVVHDAARATGKSVHVTMEGGDIELDRSILDELVDPLVHLLRNAVDHGIEAPEERAAAGKPTRGQILLRAERERTSVRISLIDDGRGVRRQRVAERAGAVGIPLPGSADDITDDDLLRVLAHPGFSTADRVTEISGRGVGLDVVAARLRALGGALVMRSVEDSGTTFIIRLPLTLALAPALRVRVAGEDYAIPLTHVREVVELQDVLVSAVGGREALRVRDDLLPLVRLRDVLRAPGLGLDAAAVITDNGEQRTALAVDELLGREQILMKSFVPARGTLPIFSGATLLADGRPALVLDPLSVV